MNAQQQKECFLQFAEELWEEYRSEFYSNQLEQLIWSLLQYRPDLILQKLSNTHLGEVKSIEANKKQVKIISQIDTGMVRNYDGSGCQHKTYGEKCEQTLIVTKEKKTYSNRHGVKQ